MPRQVHNILFPRLADGCGSQQITCLFFERAVMRRRALLETGMQGRVDIADQQAGHVRFLGSTVAGDC